MATQTAEKQTTTAYVVLQGTQLNQGDRKRVSWEEVGTYEATSKGKAIRMHTGDGPEVKEGTWKAVPASSWKGGETTKRVQAAERKALDD